MNNEIKINKANKSITFINNGIGFSQFGIADEILDLITNLQQEIKTKDEGIKAFTKDLCDTTEQLEDYKSRCEKAIEYINNHKQPLHHSFDEPDCDYWIATNPDVLLNILQNGSEKDEN